MEQMLQYGKQVTDIAYSCAVYSYNIAFSFISSYSIDFDGIKEKAKEIMWIVIFRLYQLVASIEAMHLYVAFSAIVSLYIFYIIIKACCSRNNNQDCSQICKQIAMVQQHKMHFPRVSGSVAGMKNEAMSKYLNSL